VSVKDCFQQKIREKRQNPLCGEPNKNAASDSALRRVGKEFVIYAVSGQQSGD